MIEHSMPTIGEEEYKALKNILNTNYLAEGDAVRKFEEELGNYIGSKGGVATSTGTLALHLALRSLDVKKGDEVIVPSYVCRSVLNSVLYTEAKPVLCDVNREDYNISFDDARRKITKKTKVIIVPHMYGCPADIDKFKKIGVYIIEDCAHSIGAEYKDKKIGSWGDLAIFSFEGTKYIITGEGGMVLAKTKYLLNKLRKLKEPDSLDFKVKYTYRMTNLQAAVGRVQLLKLKSFIERRRRIAKIYNEAFSRIDVELPKEQVDKQHVFHRYMIKIKCNINKFMEICYKEGVKIKRPVKPYPLHRYLGMPDRSFPDTEYIMRSAVSIPIYPLLSSKEIKYIIEVVKNAFLKLA